VFVFVPKMFRIEI